MFLKISDIQFTISSLLSRTPYLEAIAAQGEVGCLLQGIHQARELPVRGAVVGLGGVAEPAAHTADFPTCFAAVQISWRGLLTWLSLF